MKVSNPNAVKVYNLSAGKSLPEWISEKKRRKLEQKDVDIRRRIQLIQDFEMPDVSNYVQITPDGQYIYVSGTYKPRVRCYDVNNLAMKFERCLDAEVVKMLSLSSSYEKVVFLEEDRWLEFHVQYGRHHRIRIPKFGRDMVFLRSSSELLIVGSGPEVYRFSLEQGRFLTSLQTAASSNTSCAVNEFHHLFVCGTWEGNVEAWDPRCRERVGTLLCDVERVSTVKFRNALELGVGSADGQVLLFDLRASQPFLVKNQRYGLPIKCLDFFPDHGLTASMDSRALKLWDSRTGAPFVSLEPGTDLNHFAPLPGSGLLFMANEDPKVLTHFIPSLGAAPKWCSFLDAIVDELEESAQPVVYDDYRFVSNEELDGLGLSHLVGTPLLRAYMHGHFMDARLYAKAQQLANPFAFEEYRKQKIREKLEKERAGIPLQQQRPRVNRELASRLQVQEADVGKKKAKARIAGTLLRDERFKALFENPEYQVDPNTEEFKLINPVLTRLESKAQRKTEETTLAENAADSDEGEMASDDGSGFSSSDDQEPVPNSSKKASRRRSKPSGHLESTHLQKKTANFRLSSFDRLNWNHAQTTRQDNELKALGDRAREETAGGSLGSKTAGGGMEIRWTSKSASELKKRRKEEHIRERDRIRRPAKTLKNNQTTKI